MVLEINIGTSSMVNLDIITEDEIPDYTHADFLQNTKEKTSMVYKCVNSWYYDLGRLDSCFKNIIDNDSVSKSSDIRNNAQVCRDGDRQH